MELKDLMNLNVSNLAKAQHEELKKHVIHVLEKVLDAVKDEKYDDIKDMTFESPSGDGWGMDNDCINFSYSNGDKMDVMEVVYELKRLKEIGDK